MPTEKEISPRRTVEFPDPAVARLAIDDPRTPKPRALSAEVALSVFESNRIVVLALFVRPVIGNGERQSKRRRAGVSRVTLKIGTSQLISDDGQLSRTQLGDG